MKKLALLGGLALSLMVSSKVACPQLVEHDLAKVGVASSSLVSRSKFSKSHFGEVSDKSPGCGNTVWQFGKLL